MEGLIIFKVVCILIVLISALIILFKIYCPKKDPLAERLRALGENATEEERNKVIIDYYKNQVIR